VVPLLRVFLYYDISLMKFKVVVVVVDGRRYEKIAKRKKGAIFLRLLVS
jgi:hypothetical protein